MLRELKIWKVEGVRQVEWIDGIADHPYPDAVDDTKAEGGVGKHRERLTGSKLVTEEKLKIFSVIFGDIIRAVLGSTVNGWVDLGERNILFHAKRSKELGGAAVEKIKTLAFDLAAVVYSMEGNCVHPRFLIHDGPREADMARVIYERFFLYARRVEETFPTDQSTFQFILTTTHPTSDMKEVSPWLLGEKLSAKTKKGRLL